VLTIQGYFFVILIIEPPLFYKAESANLLTHSLEKLTAGMGILDDHNHF